MDTRASKRREEIPNLPGTHLRIVTKRHISVLTNSFGEEMAVWRHDPWKIDVLGTEYRKRHQVKTPAEVVEEIEGVFPGYRAELLRGKLFSVRGGLIAAESTEWQETSTGRLAVYMVGRHLARRDRACLKLPDGVWVRLPVEGSKWRESTMSAVTASGATPFEYRLVQHKSSWDAFNQNVVHRPVELVVAPSVVLESDWLLAAVVSAQEFRRYFARPN